MSTFARACWNTLNLAGLLETYKISPKRSLGQSFLSDQGMIDAIVKDLLSFSTDCFVEIGTGPGLLTYDLAQHASAVVSIEIDKRFLPLHQDLFSDLKTPPLILYEDALDVDEKRVSDLLYRDNIESANYTMPPYVLFGNLPYYLTTELILSSLSHFPQMCRAFFMIQQDVTDRLTASPGSKRYGPLAIASRLFGHWKIRRTVSRQSFYPVPRVTSKLVELIANDDSEARQLAGNPAFHTFLVALFQSRRKTIGNALSAALKKTEREARLNRALSLFLERNNLSSSVRAESLNPSHLAELFQLLQP